MYYILTNNTGSEIILPNNQTISDGASGTVNIEDYFMYAQYNQEFLEAVDNGDITLTYYNGDPVDVPKPATSIHPIQELYVSSDGRRAFTAPVSGVSPTTGNHLATQTFTEEASGNALTQANLYTDTQVAGVSGGGGTFGSEFQEESAESESNTSSTSYQQKLRLTTDSLPSGTYRIGWSYEIDGNGDTSRARVELNDDDELSYYEYDSSLADFIQVSGFKYESLSGVNTIDIDYSMISSGEIDIRRARLEIWRVS